MAASRTSDPAPAGVAGNDLLRTVAVATADVVGKQFFRALTRHVAEAFEAELSFVAELVAERPGWARILASWHGGRHTPEGTEFQLAGGACAFALDAHVAVALRGADGTHLGHLAVMSSRPLEPSDDDLAALHIFGARAAAEIERRRHEEALLAREAKVAESRARVVQSADEERRRIGRNLHDGAQQSLVVLGHFLDMARKKLDDPEQAGELIDQAREHASAAGAELRELARGLHPSRLSEQGLAAAVQVLGASSPLPLDVEEMPDRRLPDALETALYFLVAEAMTNAVKYARASRLSLSVVQRGQSIVATVADDGVGGAQRDGGTGLIGLSDRIAALDGTLEVDSPTGAGTRLRATIPLGPWRSRREPFLQ